MNNLLLITVLTPIVLGILLLIIKPQNKIVRRCISFFSVLVTSALVLVCLITRPQGELIILDLTNQIDLSFKLDGLGMVFAGLVALLWPFATLYAFEYMEHYKSQNMFFAFYVITYGVTLGIAFSANPLTMYLFYEFLTLVTTPLVLHTLTREAVKAARKYLYYSISGAAIGFVSIAFLMVYGMNVNFIYGGAVPQEFIQDSMLQFIYIFAFVGFGVKCAVFPSHGWLPSASVAPTPVTALLHAVAVVKAGAFVIMRMTYYVFGAELLKGSFAQVTVTILASITVIYASIRAVKTTHFKRRLAYSTISNLSYILLGVCMMSSFGFFGAMCHMIFHAFMKITAFSCAGAVMEKANVHEVPQLEGLGRKMPFTFTCFGIAALSLCGMPPLIGFSSKYYLMLSGIENGTWLGYLAVFTLFVATIFAVIYVMFIAVKAFFPASGTEIVQAKDPGLMMKIPIATFTIAIILLGVNSQHLYEFLSQVSNGLI